MLETAHIKSQLLEQSVRNEKKILALNRLEVCNQSNLFYLFLLFFCFLLFVVVVVFKLFEHKCVEKTSSTKKSHSLPVSSGH